MPPSRGRTFCNPILCLQCGEPPRPRLGGVVVAVPAVVGQESSPRLVVTFNQHQRKQCVTLSILARGTIPQTQHVVVNSGRPLSVSWLEIDTIISFGHFYHRYISYFHIHFVFNTSFPGKVFTLIGGKFYSHACDKK